LIDRQARFVWGCAPRVDSDPFFSALLGGRDAGEPDAQGLWTVEVEGAQTFHQSYVRNTAIASPEITGAAGAAVEIVDFCPRYRQFHRIYRPTAYIRLIRPLEGAPRITVRMRPTANWGERPARTTHGSNHIRYRGGEMTLRLTTDCPVTHVL